MDFSGYVTCVCGSRINQLWWCWIFRCFGPSHLGGASGLEGPSSNTPWIYLWKVSTSGPTF